MWRSGGARKSLASKSMRKFRLVGFCALAVLSGCGLIIGTGDFTDEAPSSTAR
jgi:hypothetical protein